MAFCRFCSIEAKKNPLSKPSDILMCDEGALPFLPHGRRVDRVKGRRGQSWRWPPVRMVLHSCDPRQHRPWTKSPQSAVLDAGRHPHQDFTALECRIDVLTFCSPYNAHRKSEITSGRPSRPPGALNDDSDRYWTNFSPNFEDGLYTHATTFAGMSRGRGGHFQHCL